MIWIFSGLHGNAHEGANVRERLRLTAKVLELAALSQLADDLEMRLTSQVRVKLSRSKNQQMVYSYESG